MRRSLLKALLLPATLLIAGLAASSARASGDFTCDPVWALKHVERDDCSNTAFLSPGNDSRINLQMLMLDRRGARAPATAPAAATDPVLFSLDDFNAAIEEFLSGKPPKAAGNSASASSDFADGEGSRCLSNRAGIDGFVAALKAARGLPEAERKALADARGGITSNCNGGMEKQVEAAQLSIKSATGKPFAGYILGAAAFYDGDFDAAHKAFSSLASSNQPWLKEASRYMLGRVELNRAQIHAFDDFSSAPTPGKVDKAALAASRAAFSAYLHDYPRGAYAASARGLQRRLDWLGGETPKLGDDYARLIILKDWDAQGLTAKTLSQEIDSKLLGDDGPAVVKDPTLLATIDLMRMRGLDEPAPPPPSSPPPPVAPAAPKPPAFGLADLEAQRPSFATAPALFDYLLAAHHFYVEADPAGVLKLLPEAAPAGAGAYLAFSRQVLRGMALDALGDKAARLLWTRLYPEARRPGQSGAVELGLALNHQRQGDLAPVFAPGSLIRNPDLRSLILRYDADATLLRARAAAPGAGDDERRLALYVLLYKEVTRGRYQAFLRDLALMPKAPPAKEKEGEAPLYDLALFDWSGGGAQAEAGFACPSLREVAGVLARRPADPHARMCLAEFIRENGLDGFSLNARQPEGQLGGGPAPFPGADPARLEIYKVVIADPNAPRGDKTYALYRAVSCYASSGNNHCDGADVPLAQRKAWFHTLKSTYASSPWAQALKYYW